MSFWDFDTLLNMKDGDILFFDEVFNGNPTVLNACLTILEEREMISGKKLPDIMIVAAANEQGMIPLTPQIKERFVWYKTEIDYNSWSNYMYDKFEITKNMANKLSDLIRHEHFTEKCNFNSARSITKAVNMMIYNVVTPYSKDLLPILSELITNNSQESIMVGTYEFGPGEQLPWLRLQHLKLGIIKDYKVEELEEIEAILDEPTVKLPF